jgi:hypothetical protein
MSRRIASGVGAPFGSEVRTRIRWTRSLLGASTTPAQAAVWRTSRSAGPDCSFASEAAVHAELSELPLQPQSSSAFAARVRLKSAE